MIHDSVKVDGSKDKQIIRICGDRDAIVKVWDGKDGTWDVTISQGDNIVVIPLEDFEKSLSIAKEYKKERNIFVLSAGG